MNYRHFQLETGHTYFVPDCAETSLSGEVGLIVNRIRIQFETKPTLKWFKLRWYCKVKDLESGTESRADDYESKDGALKHALENLMRDLKTKGIIA